MADERGLGSFAAVWRQWRLYAWLDLTWLTRNLGFFVTYFLSDLVTSAATITATLLLAARFDGIGPWTLPQLIFMLGYATLVQGLVDVFFGYNVSVVSRRIGRGQLDHTLIQPRPIWVTLLTEGFTPFSDGTAVLAALPLVVWSAARLSLVISPGWLALAALNLVASCAIVLAFAFVWGCLAFWAPRAGEEISGSALGMMRLLAPFPLDGLGPFWLGGMLTALPAGFVAWYPCRALLGIDRASYALGLTPLAAGAIVALTVVIFQKGMKHYGRVGSQRYLSFGHRR
ncbi:MAG: ABC-2 family transporter protein [Chloroflexota bacterium]